MMANYNPLFGFFMFLLYTLLIVGLSYWIFSACAASSARKLKNRVVLIRTEASAPPYMDQAGPSFMHPHAMHHPCAGSGVDMMQ